MKKVFCFILVFSLLFPSFCINGLAQKELPAKNYCPKVIEDSLELNCKSAVLMEGNTGSVLYVQNPDEALPPASVTKIMTLLLVMEAIDQGKIKLSDMVCTSEYAASMGGSQVYLKVGETMSVEDMLKSVVISSANDAAVALAECVAGDVGAFVQRMNERAAELGMTSTKFENVTGLDDTATEHLTSARDIAIMSRALIAHPTILKYSSIWMDTIRGGAFGLTNTNRLVRFYRGATGLKTGSTSKAGFCISVTAERNGLSLICVIMGAESRDIRNAQATKLLDWGFANYGVYKKEGELAGEVEILGGVLDHVDAHYAPFETVLPKDQIGKVEQKIEWFKNISAPVKAGDPLGKVQYLLDGTMIEEIPITAQEDVKKIGFFELWKRLISKILLA